ncbi:DNA-binding protein [Salinarimonas soli]|uniref:DNA-binding protein n=1 Tax=Salinarimonas soli TaxID=1638099 RepID=A0A5B2VSD5_9HYPH|nr:DNA-binding protein [Salinarimonas soli]
MDDEITRDLHTKLSVPLWPTAARALGLGRNAAYAAFARGEIPGRRYGARRITVPTAPLRKMLGIDGQEAA